MILKHGNKLITSFCFLNLNLMSKDFITLHLLTDFSLFYINIFFMPIIVFNLQILFINF